jgi:hypothetical protein
LEETGGIYAPSSVNSALRQGEILSNLAQARLAIASLIIGEEELLEIERVWHPLAIVMSQDCDLDWDCRSQQNNKKIPNILFCEVTPAESLRGRSDINSEIWKRIKQNKDERYQFIQAALPQEDAQGEGLPELAIDFKRYFTIPTEEVYYRIQFGARRRCRLQSPYLEHLCTRFGYYQFRVALPAEHFSE